MSKHILVVDDSKTIRNLLSFVFKNEGYKVTSAENGLDGLEKLYAMEQVDLIVSDVNMPHMDGLAFVASVRENEAYNAVPIVILTTEGQEEDIQKGMDAGANMYLKKPSSPDTIIRSVKQLFTS